MEAGIIESFGKFSRVAGAGFTCIKYPIENIRARVSLKVSIYELKNLFLCLLQTHQLDVTCDTKTRDNVFVQVVVSGDTAFRRPNCYVL